METTEIKNDFKKRKIRQLFIGIPLLAAVFLIAFMSESETEMVSGISNLFLIIGAGVIIILGLIFSLINWRCPSCKTYLGKKFNPKFCSSCGVELR